MPFNGNGIYNPIGAPYFPAVSGTPITANQYNLQIQDMATALSNCMTRDGQSSPVADISWALHKLTNLADPTGLRDAANKQYVDSNIVSGISAAEDRIAYRTGFRDLTGTSTGTTTLSLTAARVWLQSFSGKIQQVSSGTPLTLDLSTQGAGGRDQAGNFLNQWVYAHYIWNGTTLALLGSASRTAPTLPSGYTHSAFAVAVRVGGTNNSVSAFLLNANYVSYSITQFTMFNGALSNQAAPGAAMTLTQAVLPPIPGIMAYMNGVDDTTSGGGFVIAVHVSPTSGRRWQSNRSASSGTSNSVGHSICVPYQVGNDLRLEQNVGSGSPTVIIWMVGYTFPNGAI